MNVLNYKLTKLIMYIKIVKNHAKSIIIKLEFTNTYLFIKTLFQFLLMGE
jgi:hypothetical protein